MPLIILFISQLILIEHYLMINLVNFGVDHLGTNYLYIYFIIAIVGNFVFFKKNRTIYFKLSEGLLIIFCAYFFYRCATDLPVENWLNKFIGSDSGIIYHLIFGFLSAPPLCYLLKYGYNLNRSNSFFRIFILIFVIYTTLNSLRLAFMAYGSSREDLFLLELNDGMYQWPGDLISIRLLILTMFSAYLLSYSEDAHNRLKLFKSYLIVLLFTVQSGALIFFAQILGSNKAVITIISCWFSLLVIFFACNKVDAELIKKRVKSTTGKFKIISISFFRAIYLSFSVVSLLIAIAWLINFPFEKFRMFGFGDGQITSINSRLNLIVDGFVQQFMISPFWGHAGAEYLTLGEGSYIHSTILYTLTHTGIFGFFILSYTFYKIFMEQRFKIFLNGDEVSQPSINKGWQLKLINILLLLAILLSGIMTSSLVWGVIWFSLGLFCGIDKFNGLKIKVKF